MYKQALIIDDDYTSNLITENLLLSMQVSEQVQSILKIEEAQKHFLQAFQNHTLPDLILLDLNFPEGSGWIFLEFYKEQVEKETPKHLPKLFILTSSIARKDIEKAQMTHLVQGFISKPLLREKVSKFLLSA